MRERCKSMSEARSDSSIRAAIATLVGRRSSLNGPLPRPWIRAFLVNPCGLLSTLMDARYRSLSGQRRARSRE